MNKLSNLILWTAAAVTLSALPGCFDIDRVQGPTLGYETNIDDCSDGRDNDLDGFVDCSDPDCISRNFCGEIIPFNPPSGFEGDLESCSDGIDNDDNGQFDCGDRKCQGVQETCCITEFTDGACSDGVDNDGNNFADCQDFACRNGTFTTVCSFEADCDDGIDNDADDFADCDDRDCAADPICIINPGPENTAERCTDGIDNDGNGFLDCREFACCPGGMLPCVDAAIDTYCSNLPTENTAEDCMDGIDNDGNGFTDCSEFGCCRSGTCTFPAVQEYCDNTPAENTFELCTDGIDNDGNGFLDCNDNSCSQSDNTDLKRLCEADFESCTDFIDNDGDGFLDCADRSCEGLTEIRSTPAGNRRLSPCLESVFRAEDIDVRVPGMDEESLRAIAIQGCSDNFDGDADGILDCDDWDCQYNPLLNPRTNNPASTDLSFCEGATFNPMTGRWEAGIEGGGQPTRVLHCAFAF